MCQMIIRVFIAASITCATASLPQSHARTNQGIDTSYMIARACERMRLRQGGGGIFCSTCFNQRPKHVEQRLYRTALSQVSCALQPLKRLVGRPTA